MYEVHPLVPGSLVENSKLHLPSSEVSVSDNVVAVASTGKQSSLFLRCICVDQNSIFRQIMEQRCTYHRPIMAILVVHVSEVDSVDRSALLESVWICLSHSGRPSKLAYNRHS
ncbi:hypothetical protein AHF37_08875 [Paragonimus kellicotti]|nr:hypothetical protein AHF37_08875 [Paragonimus kellicotti]